MLNFIIAFSLFQATVSDSITITDEMVAPIEETGLEVLNSLPITVQKGACIFLIIAFRDNTTSTMDYQFDGNYLVEAWNATH